jgi:hypothetical protein
LEFSKNTGERRRISFQRVAAGTTHSAARLR